MPRTGPFAQQGLSHSGASRAAGPLAFPPHCICALFLHSLPTASVHSSHWTRVHGNIGLLSGQVMLCCAMLTVNASLELSISNDRDEELRRAVLDEEAEEKQQFLELWRRAFQRWSTSIPWMMCIALSTTNMLIILVRWLHQGLGSDGKPSVCFMSRRTVAYVLRALTSLLPVFVVMWNPWLKIQTLRSWPETCTQHIEGGSQSVVITNGRQIMLALLTGCEFLLLVQDACYNKTAPLKPPTPSSRKSGVSVRSSLVGALASSMRRGPRGGGSRKSVRLREPPSHDAHDGAPGREPSGGAELTGGGAAAAAARAGAHAGASSAPTVAR